jgi:hypothetical protein
LNHSGRTGGCVETPLHGSVISQGRESNSFSMARTSAS